MIQQLQQEVSYYYSASICLYLPLSASICLSLSLSASLCLSLLLSASLCLSLPLSASLCLPLQFFSIPLPPSTVPLYTPLSLYCSPLYPSTIHFSTSLLSLPPCTHFPLFLSLPLPFISLHLFVYISFLSISHSLYSLSIHTLVVLVLSIFPSNVSLPSSSFLSFHHLFRPSSNTSLI